MAADDTDEQWAMTRAIGRCEYAEAGRYSRDEESLVAPHSGSKGGATTAVIGVPAGGWSRDRLVEVTGVVGGHRPSSSFGATFAGP